MKRLLRVAGHNGHKLIRSGLNPQTLHSAAVQGATDIELANQRGHATRCMGLKTYASHTAKFMLSRHRELDPMCLATVPLVKGFLELVWTHSVNFARGPQGMGAMVASIGTVRCWAKVRGHWRRPAPMARELLRVRGRWQ